MTPVGVNFTCTSDCTKWCPRVLKMKCCCATVSDDEEEEPEQVTKVKNVAFENIVEKATPEDSTIRL